MLTSVFPEQAAIHRILSRMDQTEDRSRYIQLAIEGNWDTRTLQRNIASQYAGIHLNSNFSLSIADILPNLMKNI